jgi:hypothetical protein
MSTRSHKARHDNGRSTTPMFLAAWAVFSPVSVLTGIILAVSAFRLNQTSQWGSSRNDTAVVLLGLFAVLLITAPALSLVILMAVKLGRAHKAWIKSLPPEQQFAVYVAEAAAMEAAHLYFHDRHKRNSAKLTASVMGADPKPGTPEREDAWRGTQQNWTLRT